MKQLIVIFFISFFLLLNFNFIFSCHYTNQDDKTQQYNLSSLKLNPNQFWKAFVAKDDHVTSDYFIYFNMCGAVVNACGSNNTACQTYNQTNPSGTVIFPIGSSLVNEQYTFNKDGVTIIYNSLPFAASPGGNCSLNDNKRTTFLNFYCNTTIDTLKVIGNGSEVSICKYEINIQSKLACRTCLSNCSTAHSFCDQYLGICSCDSQTTGPTCSESKIYLNAVDSTYTDGGTTFLHGYFGDTNSSRLSIKIGQLNCTDIKVFNQTTISCLIGPGTGFQDVLVTDNDLSFNGQNLFQYSKKQMECPNNCTSPLNGICNTNTGNCICLGNYIGLNCNSISDPNSPPSKPNINETTGESSISNGESSYQISIYSLAEISFSGLVLNEYYLNEKWNVSLKASSDSNKMVTFSQFIQGPNCTVEYSIEEVLNNKDYSFAGVDFSLVPGSIKLSVSVRNYQYSSVLNTIQLRIKSTIDQTKTNDTDCNMKNVNVDTNGFNNEQQSNYLTISKDSKTFYGRFINRVISDGRNTVMTTSIVNTNSLYVLIGLNLPHCVNECLIDPDFSLLVSNDFKNSCDGDSKPKWFLPVVIAVPVVGASILIIVGALFYRKYRIGLKLLKQKIKLEKANST